MRALNMEETLDAMIDSSDIFAKDWHDAQEIDLNDPVMVQALAASGVTEEQIAAIRTQIEQ